jgi:SAM-dependent methyltransferase
VKHGTSSPLRIEQHRALAGLVLDGEVLDIGGSRKSAYTGFLGGRHRITFANIDPAYGADLIFDAQAPWPVEAAAWDAVLMNNLLEHLFDYEAALAEAHRALKPGGRLVLTVPFLFRLHAAPSDYFRFTRFALERILERRGFEAVAVRELGSGAFLAMYQPLATLIRPAFLSEAGRRLAVGLDRLMDRLKPGGVLSARNFPLGYLVEARRP